MTSTGGNTGYYYYGARYYTPELMVLSASGGWMSVDPLAHQFPHLTPYNFTENNPIMLVDYFGLSATGPGGNPLPDMEPVTVTAARPAYNPDAYNLAQQQYHQMYGQGPINQPNYQSTTLQTKRDPIGGINEGFGSGFMDGFGAGMGSTVDFFASLGTKQGWIDFGQGMLDVAMLSCEVCPQGMLMRAQMADRTINYIQNIPNMSAYEMGYDLGFGTEKALEIAVTRGVYTGSGVGIGSVRMLSNSSMRGTTLFKTGKNFRIDLDLRNGLHYHRRGPGGIGRHRPWQVKPGDQGDFWKRF